MSIRILIAAAAIAFTLVTPAVASGAGKAGATNGRDVANAGWVDKAVRVHFGAEQNAAITGKVTRFDGCLYVKLDQTRDGITLIRMDQVTRLQVRSGAAWAAHDVRAVLAREPAHCSAEANG